MVQLTTIHTTIAASFGGLTTLLLSILVDHEQSVTCLGNGILAGLVGITASCDVSNTYVSSVVGIVSGILYFMSSR